MKIALYCRHIREDHIPVLQNLLDLLSKKKIGVFVYKEFFESVWQQIKTRSGISTFEKHEDISTNVDYMFSLGGDGTLLDTVSFVRDQNIPVVGINIGRLGFLANIGKDEIEAAIDAIAEGSYVIDKRTMLELECSKPLFGDVKLDLNDVTVHKKDTSAMIIIHTYINGEFLNSYFADGLIVSTPTGSTAYSLSCGGPIMMPDSDNFIITPIAPHNLAVRPIVISNNREIRFKVSGRTEDFKVALDSRSATVPLGLDIKIKKADFRVNLINLEGQHFFSTLRNKMMWGIDKRH